MTASADQIARLRRMIAEPTDATYSDAELRGYIEAYPLLDERGEEPYTYDVAAEPPTREDNDNWIATYDLNAAAADVWEEKASALAGQFDFSNDAGRFDRSQAYEHAMGRTRYYRSRRSPRTVTAKQWPEETTAQDFPWIVNLPESD